MPAQWTGAFIGKLHNNGITAKEFASYLGVHPKYVSLILNGKRSPKDAEKKFAEGLEAMLKERDAHHPV